MTAAPTAWIRRLVRRLAADDAVHDLARRIFSVPSRGSSPGWVIAVFGILAHELGSATKAEAALADPAVWHDICDAGRRRYPDQPAMWPTPDQPMRRCHWQYATRRYLQDRAEP